MAALNRDGCDRYRRPWWLLTPPACVMCVAPAPPPQLHDQMGEAKDNVKYLTTLEPHLAAVREGTPMQIQEVSRL